jgi:hypothetical protein
MGFVNKSFNDIMTFTRNSTATYTDPTGVIRSVSANVPRFTFNRETGEPLGILIEEQRTRINTISLLPILPEAVTVTAAQHTISFYGTGSVVLSGAHSATLVGTGAGRVTLTFTPTAGALTLTPSGSVNDLQLELGANASSVIRGEGSAQTRLADNVSRTLGAEFNPIEGSFYIEFYVNFLSQVPARSIFELQINADNRITAFVGTGGNVFTRIRSSSINHDTGVLPYIIGLNKMIITYKNGQPSVAYLNNNQSSGSSMIAPNFSGIPLTLSGSVSSLQWTLGGKKDFRYYPRALSQAEAQALTKI